MDRTGTTSELNQQVRNAPAVGMFVPPGTDSDAVAGSILRAQRRGYGVVVAVPGDTHGEAVGFAEELGARVITVERPLSDGQGPREVVAAAMRSAGHPGVVWQSDPTAVVNRQMELDFTVSLPG